MRQETITAAGRAIPVFTLNTVVVGSGAAGYNAADRLWSFGQKDIAIVTEHVKAGTSRNTGSDKQTYYKLTLSGGDPDSVGEMAQTLFGGLCVDGDIALCEAALSASCFLHLCELGVEFPQNRYGEYIGYKTDHDPRRRATSVGPYTSKRMTEALEASVQSKGIPVFDNCQVVKILTENETLRGILCLNEAGEFVAFSCKNLIYATGGPAGIYSRSVYPLGHYGASGIAFEAGVKGRNLTEWQFGLASVKPRWNVSGTYMQVLPKFVSTDENGEQPREFLTDFFQNQGGLLSKVFLKGYQWPFDVRKIDGGSSIIDILVYLETEKGRRVFLDFRENPGNAPIDYTSVCEEAKQYLIKAGACFGKPIDRLLHMNGPAVDFYRDKGVDLTKEPLEIALCAQHNNGGLAVDCWWQTNVKGFFAAGEAAGSHGVYRPGGSALNAGQVGSARAARYIASRCQGEPKPLPLPQIETAVSLSKRLLGPEDTVAKMQQEVCRAMSRFGGAVRSPQGIKKLSAKVGGMLQDFSALAQVTDQTRLKDAFRLYDILLCQWVCLAAMENYMEQVGGSRGSALYTDENGQKPYEALPDTLAYSLFSGPGKIQEVMLEKGVCSFTWRSPRPIPEEDDFFENVWRVYRQDGNVH